MINLTAMDMGLSIGFFALFALFGSLDYATVFSLAPFVNESAITIIGLLLLTGAMAKSAQIPLHSWLPGSMEGLKSTVYFYIKYIFFVTLFFYLCLQLFSFLSLNFNFGEEANVSFDLVYGLNLPLILTTIPKETLHIITGNMLRRWFYTIF